MNGTLICNGGGDADQTQAADALFKSLLPSKHFLFIPVAIAPESWTFEKAFDWIRGHRIYDDCTITMWQDVSGKTLEDLLPFDGLYMMGGNTFTLLDKLRRSGFLPLIPAFLETGRAVMGMSAGSILMGKSIEVAQIGPPNQADENRVGLTDFSGLNLANGFTLYTHYRPEEDEQLREYAKRTGETLLGIPEESAIVMEGGEMREVGEIKKIIP